MPAATVILASLIGFRFYGLDGACVGAGVVWLLAAAGTLGFTFVDKWGAEEQLQVLKEVATQRAYLGDLIREVRAEAASIRRIQAGRGGQADYGE